MTPLVIANFPIAALFILAWVGIPLWMVLKRPDRQPSFAQARAYYRAKAELNQAQAPGTGRPVPVKARLRRPIGVVPVVLRTQHAQRHPDRRYAA